MNTSPLTWPSFLSLPQSKQSVIYLPVKNVTSAAPDKVLAFLRTSLFETPGLILDVKLSPRPLVLASRKRPSGVLRILNVVFPNFLLARTGFPLYF